MKRDKRKLRLLIAAFVVIIAVTAAATLFFTKTLAEQSGSSPESGATSRIKTLYDSLVSLGFGSNTDTPDWGSEWNRIKTAASFAPAGNAAVTDVKTGKTFYGSNRTIATGTYSPPSGCSTQQYQSSHASASSVNNCSITWVTASPAVTGDDKQDPRTGLVWSKYLQNVGGVVTFVNSSGSSWTWDATGGNNVAVGNKTASQICSERGNGWRLPSQIDMVQAYSDGTFWNLTNPANTFWTMTESPTFNAWKVNLGDGSVSGDAKGAGYFVRCVR